MGWEQEAKLLPAIQVRKDGGSEQVVVAESVRVPFGIFQRLWMRSLRESFSVLELLVA